MKTQNLLAITLSGTLALPLAAQAHRAYDFTGGSDAGASNGATTAGARPASTSAAAPMPSPKLIAWVLGGELTLTAVLYEQGGAAEKVDPMLQRCAAMAQALNVRLPALPKRTGVQKTDIVNALQYILKDLGGVAQAIARRHGLGCGTTFDIAVKANLLQLLYEPGGKTSAAIASAIKSEARAAGLPASVWSPLVNAVARRGSSEQIHQALDQMDDSARAYLQSHGRSGSASIVSYQRHNRAVVKKHIAAQPTKPVNPETAEFEKQFGEYFKSK